MFEVINMGCIFISDVNCACTVAVLPPFCRGGESFFVHSAPSSHLPRSKRDWHSKRKFSFRPDFFFSGHHGGTQLPRRDARSWQKRGGRWRKTHLKWTILLIMGRVHPQKANMSIQVKWTRLFEYRQQFGFQWGIWHRLNIIKAQLNVQLRGYAFED